MAMRNAYRSTVAVTAACMLLLMATGSLAAHSRSTASAFASSSGIGSNLKMMRRRMQAEANAVAEAYAEQGAQVSSVSEAISDGAPASSTVKASGSGEGTVINCEQEARSGQTLSKECTSGVAPWASAPKCSKAASEYQVVKDQQGNPWGYENGNSCALRDDNGNPTAQMG